MIWVEISYVRQVFKSLWIFKNDSQYPEEGNIGMINTNVYYSTPRISLKNSYDALDRNEGKREERERNLVDSAASLCWCLFSPDLSPFCINEVTGKVKITMLMMALKEENKWAKPQVKEEIVMHVESPRNSIQGAWHLG